MANLLSWFEIPAGDMDRAIAFYSTVLGKTIEKTEFGSMPYAFLPMEGEGVGGALSQGEGLVPGRQGPLIYLAAGDDLNVFLGRVEAAGGHIEVTKTPIGGGMGYFAIFLDTEGNRVGLHSMQ